MSGSVGRRRNNSHRNSQKNDGVAVEIPQSGGNTVKVPFIELRNWEGGTMQDAISFFERKSRVKLLNPKQTGGLITAQIGPNETRDAEKWNGVRFAGEKLGVKVVYKTQAQSAETSATVQILQAFLQSRYNAASQLLNLGQMMSDPTLQSHGLLSNPTTALKMFQALMRLAGDNLPQVQSVSLEANFLADTETVVYVANAYPKLLNLSLANNQITSVGTFTKIKNKFPNLRELVLAGNPLMQSPTFQQQAPELVSMFPRLLILDGVTVRNEADLPKNALPFTIKPTFFEDQGVASVTPHFLTNFFNLWDFDRNALLSLYDQASVFSICLDSAAPHLPSSKPAQSAYVQISRNLQRNTGQQARHHRIFFGPTQVASAFSRVPQSKHDLANASAFAIDSWKISDVRSPGDTAIMMLVHGEFLEQPGNIIRSFDRSLVVLPGPQGSYIVASDTLVIRMQSSLPVSLNHSTGSVENSLAAGNSQVNPPISTSANVSIPSAPNPTQPLNQPGSLVQELMQQTGLVAEYAEMCLKQANFDPNTAMQLFQQSRAQLPPNAFRQN